MKSYLAIFLTLFTYQIVSASGRTERVTQMRCVTDGEIVDFLKNTSPDPDSGEKRIYYSIRISNINDKNPPPYFTRFPEKSEEQEPFFRNDEPLLGMPPTHALMYQFSSKIRWGSADYFSTGIFYVEFFASETDKGYVHVWNTIHQAGTHVADQSKPLYKLTLNKCRAAIVEK